MSLEARSKALRGVSEGETYGSENGVHEFVECLGVHEPAALEDAHCQLGNHGQVALEVVADNVAQLVVVL